MSESRDEVLHRLRHVMNNLELAIHAFPRAKPDVQLEILELMQRAADQGIIQARQLEWLADAEPETPAELLLEDLPGDQPPIQP